MSIAAIGFLIAAAGFIGASVVAFMFYDEFFVPEQHPKEWKVLYAGLAVVAVSLLSTGFHSIWNMSILLQIGVLGMLLGACLLAVSSYLLWHKFKL
jgi:hypothetical protein